MIYSAILLTLLASTPPWNLPSGGGGRDSLIVIQAERQITFRPGWMIDEPPRLTLNGDTLHAPDDYTWVDSLNLIVIANNPRLTPGDTLHIIWRSAAVSDQLTYWRYRPLPPDTTLPFAEATGTGASPSPPLASWGNLHRSGAITRGVQFGNGGGITSGLHLELNGSPTRGVDVTAEVDDRNLPASNTGASSTLGELDRMLFSVRASRYQADLGDYDLSWRQGRYGAMDRRLKGAIFRYNDAKASAELAAAGDDNRYRTIQFNGRDGDQGPYELTDRYGAPGVTVITGTETIWLNGEQLMRGRRADYTIDYQQGRITFNPNRPIRSDSRIEAEYEYAAGDYARQFYATSAGYASAQSGGYSLRVQAIQEGADRTHPLAFDWNDVWRRVASNAGDNPRDAVVSGIDSVGWGSGDYIRTTSGADTILVFSPPDSIGRPTGYLQVEFTADSSGAYRRDYDPILQAFYYRWVGSGLGGWSPIRILPLPDRLQMADIIAGYSSSAANLSAELAMSNYDRNTLSSIGDGDNSGNAFNIQGAADLLKSGRLKMTSEARHQDNGFRSPSRSQDADQGYLWNLPQNVEGAESAYESSLNFRPTDALSLNGNGGYLERAAGERSRRGFVGAYWNDYGWNLNGNAAIATANDAASRRSQRTRLEGIVARDLKYFKPQYAYRTERLQFTGRSPLPDGYSYWEQELGATARSIKDDRFRTSFAYRHDDRLVGGLRQPQSDSRTATAGWQGRRNAFGDWDLSLMHRTQTYADSSRPADATSASLVSRIAPPQAAWQLRLDYNLTTGNDRAGAQVATYIGGGRGGWRREGTRYVPDPAGDWQISDVPTDTLRRSTKLNFDGEFYVKPHGVTRSGETIYPLGITGSRTRMEAAITSAASDPTTVFYMDPRAFRAPTTAYSRLTLTQDLDFLEGNPHGDGRLTIRHEQDRDRTLNGGELQSTESLTFRLRQRFVDWWRMQWDPEWQQYLRRGLSGGRDRARVTGTGLSATAEFLDNSAAVSPRLTAAGERRHDAASGVTVNERRLSPGATFRLGAPGSLRADLEWRRLNASSASAGYDITRGYAIGQNWTLTASADYRLGASLSANATYSGLWRGRERPVQSGVVELTARF